MIEIARHRSLSWNVARSDVRQAGQGDISHGRQGKSGDIRRADVAGGVGDLRYRAKSSASDFLEMSGKSMFLTPSPVPSARSAR